jgi:hypothetical protein
MRNLYIETVEAIQESGHSPVDVVFIGSEESGHQCNWTEFRRLADVEYDQGCGAARVATDLVIVFSDGQQMWRGEYDGSEWWEFSHPFRQPSESKPISRLVVDMKRHVGWKSLAEIHEED